MTSYSEHTPLSDKIAPKASELSVAIYSAVAGSVMMIQVLAAFALLYMKIHFRWGSHAFALIPILMILIEMAILSLIGIAKLLSNANRSRTVSPIYQKWMTNCVWTLTVSGLLASSVIITLWEMSNPIHHLWTIMIPICILQLGYGIKILLTDSKNPNLPNKLIVLTCCIAQSALLIVNNQMELLLWRIAFIPGYAALGGLFLLAILQTQRQSWFENSRKGDQLVRIAVGDALIAILAALVIFLLGSYLDGIMKANYTVFLFGAIWLAVSTGVYLMRIGKYVCGTCNPSIEYCGVE